MKGQRRDMSAILVEVSGGLARIVAKPLDVEVEVVDLDQLRAGAYKDVHRFWKYSLSARARKYVRANYAELARHLDARVRLEDEDR
jgi:hypothetical protein